MKKDSEETQMPNFAKRKCKDCGQEFEVRVDKASTLYGSYCSLCFFTNVHLYADGYMALKTEEEKVKDLSYKSELQEVTHRGKKRCET